MTERYTYVCIYRYAPSHEFWGPGAEGKKRGKILFRKDLRRGGTEMVLEGGRNRVSDFPFFKSLLQFT